MTHDGRMSTETHASQLSVLVTGATGNVGRAVVSELTALGVPFIAASSDIPRAHRVLGGDIETRTLDFERPETFAPAVSGIAGVFLLRPPAVGNVADTLNVLVDRAVEAGVRHVTFLSVDGADRQRWVPHYKVERHLVGAGIGYTLLRPGFFAQNLGDAYLDDLRERSEIVVPAGNGKVAFVDVRDVAVLAARSFVDAAYRDVALSLTGPEAVSFHDVAEVLSSELGRPVRYRPSTMLGYAVHVRRQGAPWGQAAIQTLLHVGLRFGQAERVDPTLEAHLGARPRTIEDYVRDHRDLWT